VAKTFHWYGKEVAAKVDRKLKRAFDRIGTAVVADIRENMAAGRHGKGRPSPPGSPPAVQTARLIRSITHEPISDGVRVGTNVTYGKHLELGTRKMAPRPFLVPAVHRNKRLIDRELTGLL
jgi:hypothetical protein